MSVSALHILCFVFMFVLEESKICEPEWYGATYRCHHVHCWVPVSGHGCWRPRVMEIPQKLIFTSKSSCLYLGLSL